MNINMNLNMDSFVNKLRNTVSQVAYQVNTSVNTIIPGNLIHREYETFKLRCTFGSPGFVWSVYDAVKRDSASLKASLKDAIGPNIMSIPTTSNDQAHVTTDASTLTNDKQLFSVFVFDKNQIEALASKQDKEAILEHIKKGVTQLTRLRHPAILTVHHPIEESRSSLAFVTEHVYGHLDSILKEQRIKRVKPKQVSSSLIDLSQETGPKDSDHIVDSCELDEIQIKAGLLQVCDGLKFLHHDAKILHRNLCLDNIFVDSNNTWKIAGFDFSCQVSSSQSVGNVSTSTTSTSLVEYNPNFVSNLPSYPSLKATLSKLPTNVAPNWSCSAPEHSNAEQVTSSSDIYSLGLITCALLSPDRDIVDLSYEYGLISDTYKRGIHFREIADSLPSSIKSSVMKYAAINIDSRPTLDDYQNLPIFTDPQVQAIRDLDSQLAWDRLRKIDYFNRLRDVLPRLSHQVKVNRVARSLFNEVVNPDMVPHVLPSILIIAKDTTPTEFKSKIFPNLKGPFRILEPRSIPLMLLDNLAVLADRAKLCLADFQQSAFTLIQYLLRMDQQMQEKCLTVLPSVRRHIDSKSMHDILLPEIKRLCNETTVLKIRIKCLECIGSLVEVMEKSTIVRQVLPIVFEIPSRESPVVMAAVSIIKTFLNDPKADVDKDILAGKILPFLIPITIEKDLTLQDFDTIMKLIKNLMDRIEREQRSLLSRKNQVTNPKSNPLVLNNFKGSNHFQLD